MSNSPSSHPPAAVDSLEGKLAVDNDKALRDMQETFMRTLDKAGDNKHQAFKKWLEHERIQNSAQNGYGINWAGIDSILSDEERRTFALGCQKYRDYLAEKAFIVTSPTPPPAAIFEEIEQALNDGTEEVAGNALKVLAQ